MDDKYLNQLLGAAVKSKASDIHLKVGTSPIFRLVGQIREVKAPKLSASDTRDAALILIQSEEVRKKIDSIKEFDGSYSVPQVGRFRINVFKQRGTIEIILRVIPYGIPTMEDLGLPPIISEICKEERGLILVTGITGSGKSSTLAAMIGFINKNYKKHILTIEDPIEFLHPDEQSSMSQREIGTDTDTFAAAMRSALREDPDIILVGEMRDYETINIAIKAAETGHLVLSTVHTTDASKTIGRIISVFPPEEQNMVRIRLAETLKATISQRLLPKKDGKGRAVALEIMRTSLSIQECIQDPTKTDEIKQVIERGSDTFGTISFDQHLSQLYKSGVLDLEVAKAGATNASDFERALNFE